tara:strand:+ start:484 stop:1203 length:720 start_codon:yes stop_codon:yes gene_type:complete
MHDSEFTPKSESDTKSLEQPNEKVRKECLSTGRPKRSSFVPLGGYKAKQQVCDDNFRAIMTISKYTKNERLKRAMHSHVDGVTLGELLDSGDESDISGSDDGEKSSKSSEPQVYEYVKDDEEDQEDQDEDNEEDRLWDLNVGSTFKILNLLSGKAMAFARVICINNKGTQYLGHRNGAKYDIETLFFPEERVMQHKASDYKSRGIDDCHIVRVIQGGTSNTKSTASSSTAQLPSSDEES